jgi:hypothetical protein
MALRSLLAPINPGLHPPCSYSGGIAHDTRLFLFALVTCSQLPTLADLASGIRARCQDLPHSDRSRCKESRARSRVPKTAIGRKADDDQSGGAAEKRAQLYRKCNTRTSKASTLWPRRENKDCDVRRYAMLRTRQTYLHNTAIYKCGYKSVLYDRTDKLILPFLEPEVSLSALSLDDTLNFRVPRVYAELEGRRTTRLSQV